jgi:hypothetical protein
MAIGCFVVEISQVLYPCHKGFSVSESTSCPKVVSHTLDGKGNGLSSCRWRVAGGFMAVYILFLWRGDVLEIRIDLFVGFGEGLRLAVPQSQI